MIRLSNFLMIWSRSLSIALCMIMPQCCNGQSDYVDVCLAQIKETVGKPSDYLFAKSKLTDALCDSDLSLALSNCQQTLEVALVTGDKDAITLARLQEMIIQSLRKGRRKTGFDESDFELSQNASPEQKVLFHYSIINYLFWLHSIESDFKTHFEIVSNAAAECNDPHLVARLDSAEVAYRLQRLNQSNKDPAIMALTKRLQESAKQFPYLDSQIHLHLIEVDAAVMSGKKHRALEREEDAYLTANDISNKRMMCLRSFDLGTLNFVYRDFDEALVCFERMERLATEIQAQPFVHLANRRIARVYRKLGKTELAEKHLELAKNSPAFADQPFLNRQELYEDLVSVNRHLGNERRVKDYQSELIPSLGKREIQRQQKEKLELIEQAAEARIAAANEKARLEQEFYQNELATNKKIATLWSFLIASIVVVLLLFVFAIWKRLSRVSSALVSEKAISRQSQQELDALGLRLNRMQRMESLGLMAGSVAHDFNNILVGVLGNAEVIQMKRDLSDESFVQERISSIIKSAEKATSLSRQMLAYSGKQTIARFPSDINDLIQQYEAVLKSACGESHALSFQLADSPLVSKIDPTQIEQVLLNLVTNAVEASAENENARIVISTGRESVKEIDSTLHGDRTIGGEFNYLEVRDYGKGISEETIERIFEPFFSSSDSGRGLGLAVVYGVVKGHDGLIQCESEIDKGTCFRVLLPTSDETVKADETRLAQFEPIGVEHPQSGESPQTLLVIDDEESVLDLCKQLFELSGWRVITAIGGRRGTEIADAMQEHLSCILLDVVMPDMGANEVLNELETRQIDLPVVIMSGFSQTKLEFLLQRENVNSVVQKPFHAMEIQQAVKEAALSVPDGIHPNAITNEINPALPHHAK